MNTEENSTSPQQTSTSIAPADAGPAPSPCAAAFVYLDELSPRKLHGGSGDTAPSVLGKVADHAGWCALTADQFEHAGAASLTRMLYNFCTRQAFRWGLCDQESDLPSINPFHADFLDGLPWSVWDLHYGAGRAAWRPDLSRTEIYEAETTHLWGSPAKAYAPPPCFTLTVVGFERADMTEYTKDTCVVLLRADGPTGLAAASLQHHLQQWEYNDLVGSWWKGHSTVKARLDGTIAFHSSTDVCPLQVGESVEVFACTMDAFARAFFQGNEVFKDLAWAHVGSQGFPASELKRRWQELEDEKLRKARQKAAIEKAVLELAAAGDVDARREARLMEWRRWWAKEDEREEAEYAEYQANYGGDDDDREPPDCWYALITDMGHVRYRQIEKMRGDPHYSRGNLEVVHAGVTYEGSYSGCVDGHSSYSLGRVHASSTPYLDTKGQDYAESAYDFIRYALPLLVRGLPQEEGIGQPMDDDDLLQEELEALDRV